MSQGVRKGRVSTRGMGESEPRASDETEAGRQHTRRVEVAIDASDSHKAELARRNPR